MNLLQRFFFHWGIGLFMGCVSSLAGTPGSDVAAVFAKAREGAPLRCVAFGGSITQAGRGWIEPWLRRKFPASEIVMINAGMSATGSQLGVFRIGRDVIAWQPDLVLIEFCVNDGSLGDEATVCYLESIIVRLKQLSHPPAIVMVEAAARNGVNLRRHRQVARHYGLIEVDLQKAVDEILKSDETAWTTLFSDDVHPNEKGHAFYAETISASLEPLLKLELEGSLPSLPKPLSAVPLLLDGEMVPLSTVVADGWHPENSLPFWWNRFFRGVLISEDSDAVLSLSIRGTSLGIMFPMHPDYGRAWVSVDGQDAKQLLTNSRAGYDILVAAENLPAREHVLEIVPESNGTPVRLGYLLRAGQSHATSETSAQGKLSARLMRSLVFLPIPADNWKWSGPYPLEESGGDAGKEFRQEFPPETSASASWQAMPELQADGFHFLLADKRASVVYAETVWESPSGHLTILAFAADYFAKLWVNDDLRVNWGDAHGSPQQSQFVPVELKAGQNRIRIKLGSGSKGFGFSLKMGNTGEL